MIAHEVARTRSLVKLGLGNNRIGKRGGQALIQALAYNESIVELVLSSEEGLHRNSLGPESIKPLQEILAFNKFLSILDLSGNSIGNNGLKYICNGMSDRPYLQCLKIGQNDITSQGAEML